MREPEAQQEERAESATELCIDETIEESFPASDPPSWTLGVSCVPGASRLTRDV